MKLGMELSNAFITRRDEGSALLVTQECLAGITVEVDHVTRIAMLEKQCDILLFIYDYLSKHHPPPTPPPRPPSSPSPSSPLTHRARVMIDAVKKLSRGSISHDDDTAACLEKDVSSSSSSVGQPFVPDSINGGVIDVDPSSSSSSSTSIVIEKSKTVRLINQQLASSSFDDTYRQSFPSILSLCTTIIEENLHLHRSFYNADIVEPISFSLALARRSKVLELQLREEQSLQSMQAAEEAAVRTLGGQSEEAIAVALEVGR